MENLKEEIHYCTTCGASNKKSAVFCEYCKKKIIVRHRPIVDFLKKRAKGRAAGKVTENLFELIRDFLFNHLYGMVLTVSVVATATVAVTTATPYIENVKSAPEAIMVKEEVSAEPVIEETSTGVFELTESDVTWLKHVLTAYDAEIDNTRRSGETYWSDPEEYTSATELWAENNIEGYTYKGRHELYDNPVPMGQDEYVDYSDSEWTLHYRYTTSASAKTGSNVKSALGHTLLADGYDVMEVDFYALSYVNSVVTWDRFDFNALPPEGAYEKYVYTFLLTRKHGEKRWHIAEEVLTEKFGGPRYAV